MADRSAADIGLFEIRKFKPDDLARCIDIAVETWPGPPPRIPEELNVEYWRFIVTMTEAASDWREVAYESGSVIGFLFGRSSRKISRAEIGKMGKLLFASFGGVVLRNVGNIRRVLSFLCRGILSETKVWLHTPKSDGDVSFFVVSPAYTGKGIGKTLMKRFLLAAVEKDAKRISVYTTNPGCNWKFYEIVGFKKMAEFDDDLVSFYEHQRTKGLIYSIDL